MFHLFVEEIILLNDDEELIKLGKQFLNIYKAKEAVRCYDEVVVSIERYFFRYQHKYESFFFTEIGITTKTFFDFRKETPMTQPLTSYEANVF